MEYFKVKRGSENAPLELPKQMYNNINEYKSSINAEDSPRHFHIQYIRDNTNESSYRNNILNVLSNHYQHNSVKLIEVENEFISANSMKKKKYEYSRTLKYKDLINNKLLNLKNYYIIEDLTRFKDINNEMKKLMNSLSSKYTGNTLTIEFHVFNSSNTFHQHGASYSYLLKGIKKWFIYSKLPSIGYNPKVNGNVWYNSSYEVLKKGSIHITYTHSFIPSLTSLLVEWMPIELTQYPGDLIYIPEGYYHTCISTSSEVAVSVSSQVDISIGTSFYYYKEAINNFNKGKIKESLQYIDAALKLNSHDSNYHYLAALIYSAINDDNYIIEIENHLKQAANNNYQNVPAIEMLYKILKNKNDTASDTMANGIYKRLMMFHHSTTIVV
jgi:hypothetical protein